ncbi:hypothetical protein ACKTEK_13990 [Tepidamorphus sp. 3E244]|uniref:hypothetical protein n=1 Tax=Tepidamorphus sp. 3E244 TaxID=3385498 RepID=UPI0038FCFB32
MPQLMQHVIVFFVALAAYVLVKMGLSQFPETRDWASNIALFTCAAIGGIYLSRLRQKQ